MTPESKVKRKVKEILAARGHALRAFWPVQNGLGEATLDAHVCYRGRYLIIETKAPGEKPTPRQANTLKEYGDAQARTLVLDGSNYHELGQVLDGIELDFIAHG